MTKNIKVKQDRNHVLIIDDYSVFSTLSCARDVGLLSEFLRLISKRLKKMFLFFCKETLSAEETAVVYNLASDLAYLQLLPESIGSICNNTKRFSCDLLKIRHDRRVSHEVSIFIMCYRLVVHLWVDFQLFQYLLLFNFDHCPSSTENKLPSFK